MTHTLTDDGEIKVTTFTAEGEYTMWLSRNETPIVDNKPLNPPTPAEKKDELIAKLEKNAKSLLLFGVRCRRVNKGKERRPTPTDPFAADLLVVPPPRAGTLQRLRCCAVREDRTSNPRLVAVGRRGRLVPT